MGTLMGLAGGASPMGAMPSMASSSSASTGEQDQSGSFTGSGINFGTNGNNQLMIIGAVAIGLLLVMKRK